MIVLPVKDKEIKMKKLIKFQASWCQPCKSLSKNIKFVDLSELEFVEIDIDEDAETSLKYKIRGVPTLVLEEDGKEIRRKSGVMMANEIEEFIK